MTKHSALDEAPNTRQQNSLDPPCPRKPIRLAVLQRVCPTYRLALFEKLQSGEEIDTILIVGEDLPNSKVRNASDLGRIRHIKVATRFLKMGKRILVHHKDIINRLRALKPDVVLCEGESHFVGYIQASIYRAFYRPRTALIHWCYISLPGRPIKEFTIPALIKHLTRKLFDAFLLYSSYSQQCLLELGVPKNRTFVATNVGDTDAFIRAADSLDIDRATAKALLGLPDRFTVLYVGALEGNKHPRMLLDLAAMLSPKQYSFVLLGQGRLLATLRQEAKERRLENVRLPGLVTEELHTYYRAADAMLIPGRGGIIISEAMIFGLPVIVHQADGTEFDLVIDRHTGIRLTDGSIQSTQAALAFLSSNPEACRQIGRNASELIRGRYRTHEMVNAIKRATFFAHESRKSAEII